MAKDEKKIKELEDIIGTLYNKFGTACKLCDQALSALKVRGHGAPASYIRIELNKIKP